MGYKCVCVCVLVAVGLPVVDTENVIIFYRYQGDVYDSSDGEV